MPTIDLNADLGEGFSIYRIPGETELWSLISSANIACGGHAGDPNVMVESVARAVSANVAVGAHPGYPDREGFGRRDLVLNQTEISALILTQTGALQAVATAAGTKVRYLKPHGALYNRAANDSVTAAAIVSAVQNAFPTLTLLGLNGSKLLAAATAAGIPIAREVFADRAYQPDGTLLPRSLPGAVLHDPVQITERTLRMLDDNYVVAVDGTRRIVRPDSVCVHGDNPNALAILEAIRNRLEKAGFTIAAFTQ